MISDFHENTSGSPVNTNQGLGFNQAFNPQIPPPSPYNVTTPNVASDTNFFMACNQGIANGFGPWFFNIRDPTFLKTNEPVRQRSSYHVAVLVVTLILFACIVIGAIGASTFLGIGGTIGIILASYFLYLILSCCCSQLKQYLSNTKRYQEYQQTYDKMTKGRGYFTFFIECYHYQTRHRTVRRNGRTHTQTYQQKVVTHTARQNFNVTESFDQSGLLMNIADVKPYVFLNYLKRFYFADDQSQRKFVAAFNSFVNRNRRDVHQNYSHDFQIQNFQEFVSFNATGQTSSIKFWYVFTILGLGIIYACIIERYIARYELGILKRLTII